MGTKKPQIKNLILDFGNVLVNYDYEAFFRKNIPDTGKSKQLFELICSEEMLKVLDREATPFHEIVEELIRSHKEFEQELLYFRDHYSAIVTGEVPGMSDLLTRLKSKGYKLYGLTNWCHKVHDTMKVYPIFKLLDGRIISSEEKLIKPEAAIFQRLCDRYHLKAEECVFIDDNEKNVNGGRQFGISGILFKNAAQLEEELRKLLKPEYLII